MARMALEESQDCSWVARGSEVISFLVCLLYAFKAAESIVSKFVEEVEVNGTWDIVQSMELVGHLRDIQKSPGGQMTPIHTSLW